MKSVFVFAFFVCLAFPVFSQDPNVPRFRQLSDSMGTTASNSKSTLDNFDLIMSNNDNLNTYTSYKSQHANLVRGLQESENRLNQLIRANALESSRKEERDNYERLIKRLETVKSEYDNWLQSVR